MMKYGDEEIKFLLDSIYDGTITERELPQDLYFAIADYLKKGVYNGYGYNISSLSKEIGKKASKATLEDLELLAELRTNIYMFSAAKTYQQVKEMTSYLVNEKGTVTPFNEFKEKAMKTFDQYNKTWLRTEYDTAVGQAQSAMSWRQIEVTSDILPLLEYDAIIDKSTSDICRHMDGIVAPVNDPIWKKYTPLNHFNCRCLLRQHAEGDRTPSSKDQKNKAVNAIDPEMQDVFKMNAGMDGYIFKKDHPYFVVPKADKDFAQENFGLPIPKTDEGEKLHRFEPAIISEKWGMKLDKRVFDLLERPITAVETTGSSQAVIGRNEIEINVGARWQASKYHQKNVLYHEIGHIAHSQRYLISCGRNVSEQYAQHFSEMKKMVANTGKEIDDKLIKLYRDTMSSNKAEVDQLLSKYKMESVKDIREAISGTLDSLMALTNSKYGQGHTKKYMKVVGYKEAEMFAHSCENAFGGNLVFKEAMPDVYEASIQFIENLLK